MNTQPEAPEPSEQFSDDELATLRTVIEEHTDKYVEDLTEGFAVNLPNVLANLAAIAADAQKPLVTAAALALNDPERFSENTRKGLAARLASSARILAAGAALLDN